MRYWWVNQNQTYEHEVSGGYLWSPKTNANGTRNQFYENMKLVAPGDVIMSFAGTYIKAVGIATGRASTAPRPTNFGTVGQHWGEEGWYVSATFRELPRPMRPREHMGVLSPLLPRKYAPLQQNGNGLQGVYLTELSPSLAKAIMNLLGRQVDEIITAMADAGTEALNENTEKEIMGRTDLAETEKEQLIKSRRGQGLFRSRVELVEKKGCRVTRITAHEHLKASHIKPWRESNNIEKLDGNNGLLLAPHIDHLFDHGYMSFADDGQILISTSLDSSVLEAWHVNVNQDAGDFSPEQRRYLAYHRQKVFKQ